MLSENDVRLNHAYLLRISLSSVHSHLSINLRSSVFLHAFASFSFIIYAAAIWMDSSVQRACIQVILLDKANDVAAWLYVSVNPD